MSEALVVLDQIHQQLATITSIAEAAELADKAAAIEHYVKRSRKSLEAQNYCAYVRIAAQRRVGELLEGTHRLKGRPEKDSHAERLSDLGLSHNDSHRWRLLTKLPHEAIESERKECTARGEELTTALIMRRVKTFDPLAYAEAQRPWENRSDRPESAIPTLPMYAVVRSSSAYSDD